MSQDSSPKSVLVLIAGVSGAGKTSAINFLSDLGFETVANLPVALLPEVVNFSRRSLQNAPRAAILLDVRRSSDLADLDAFLSGGLGGNTQILKIFLDANPETLIKRYSETRRPHPGFDPREDKTLSDAITREKVRLLPFRERANLVLDTSRLSIHDLRRELRTFVESLGSEKPVAMRINVLSFGFKHGLPLDCDLVIDVRFLPNPYFVPLLRERPGTDDDVRDYVMSFAEASDFVTRYTDLLNFLIPRYAQEGKAYLNIGVGCTGGMHRSVVLAQCIADILKKRFTEHQISVRNRDLPQK